LHELPEGDVSLLLEKIPFDGKLIVYFNVTVIEKLEPQFAQREMVARNSAPCHFYFEEGWGELAEDDLEGVVGRCLDDAAMHVSAQKCEEIGEGVVFDQRGLALGQKSDDLL